MMFVGAALYTITVIVAVTIIKHYRNKARRLAMASVLKRIGHEDIHPKAKKKVKKP